MMSVAALISTAVRRSGSPGWDDPAECEDGQQGRERHAGSAGVSDEPVAAACLRAYRLDAAGRLALAALGQHHGPLG